MKKNYFKNKTELMVFFVSFFVALAFFLFQRRFFSWDFSVYVMNAEYALGQANGYGHYFEWLRPPLASFLIMLFRFVSRNFAIYAFVIFSTLFYFFSLKLFHDKFLKNIESSWCFYLFMINPFVLFYGLGMGTELISLSLVMLFLVFSFSAVGFVCFGGALLTRYSNIVLLPLLFLSKNIKKILLGLGIILLVFLPWLLINYIFTGHALTSPGDYYALNSLEQPKPQLNLLLLAFHLLLVFNVSLPFFAIGLLKKNGKDEKKIIVPLFMIAILTLVMYLINPIKDQRFLFNLSLPIAYFSVFGFDYLNNLKNKKKVEVWKIFLVCLLLVSSLSVFPLLKNTITGITREEQTIKQIITKLDNCTVASDLWVYFNWYGKKAVPPPRALNLTSTGAPKIFSMIDEGYNIILFKNSEAFRENENFVRELKEYIIEENEKYVWLRNNERCRRDHKINETYIDSLKPFGEFPENFGGCDALLTRLKLRKICRIFPFL